MADSWAQLEGGRYLADLYQKDSIQAAFLQKVIDAVNHIAQAAGVGAVGEAPPPEPIAWVNAKASGELLHVTLTHGTTKPISRPIHYYAEIDTNPNFTQPHVFHLGSSRESIVHLPTFDDNMNQHNYYVRAYSQYVGSQPSKPTVFGGPFKPTAIQMAGTTKLSLLPSTGSGTASFTGQQGAQGAGKHFLSQKPNPKSFNNVEAPVTLQAAPTLEKNPVTFNAFATTALSQSGTTTAINVAAATFQFADGTVVNVPAGSVDPGAYGTYYVYADGPTFPNGAKFVATPNLNDVYLYHWRYGMGKITTSGAGGGSGGGGGGGGGRGLL